MDDSYPNAVRTALCLDGLWRIVGTMFARFNPLMRLLFEGIVEGVYADFPREPVDRDAMFSEANARTFFELKNYFGLARGRAIRIERQAKQIKKMKSTSDLSQLMRKRDHAVGIAFKQRAQMMQRIIFNLWNHTVRNEKALARLNSQIDAHKKHLTVLSESHLEERAELQRSVSNLDDQRNFLVDSLSKAVAADKIISEYQRMRIMGKSDSGKSKPIATLIKATDSAQEDVNMGFSNVYTTFLDTEKKINNQETQENGDGPEQAEQKEEQPVQEATVDRPELMKQAILLMLPQMKDLTQIKDFIRDLESSKVPRADTTMQLNPVLRKLQSKR